MEKEKECIHSMEEGEKDDDDRGSRVVDASFLMMIFGIGGGK